MYIQYLNIEPHTVADGFKEYVFEKENVLEIPDKLGIYLCAKYKNSFKKSEAPVKREIVKITKDIIKEVVSYILYTKKANSTTWESLPVNMETIGSAAGR